MQLQTILNRVQGHKGFVYESAHWVKEKAGPALEVKLWPVREQQADLFELWAGRSWL